MLGEQNLSVTLNINTDVSQTVRAEVMGMLPQITESIKGAVADARLRGGRFKEERFPNPWAYTLCVIAVVVGLVALAGWAVI